MKVYLSRPISQCDMGKVKDWYTTMGFMLQSAGHTPVIPLNGLGALEKFPNRGELVLKRDFAMVAGADAVLCDLSMADKVSIGCLTELAWAYALGLYVVLVMIPDGPHDHSFVRHGASVVFEDLVEAVNYLCATQL